MFNKKKNSNSEHLNWLVSNAMNVIMKELPNRCKELAKYGITPGEAREDLAKYRQYFKKGIKGGYYFSTAEINKLQTYIEIENSEPDYYYADEKNLSNDEEYFNETY